MKNDEDKPDWLSSIDDEEAKDAERVGRSNIVCASLRRNFETIAMRAVKGS